jgi:hypothetical protein
LAQAQATSSEPVGALARLASPQLFRSTLKSL